MFRCKVKLPGERAKFFFLIVKSAPALLRDKWRGRGARQFCFGVRVDMLCQKFPHAG